MPTKLLKPPPPPPLPPPSLPTSWKPNPVLILSSHVESLSTTLWVIGFRNSLLSMDLRLQIGKFSMCRLLPYNTAVKDLWFNHELGYSYLGLKIDGTWRNCCLLSYDLSVKELGFLHGSREFAVKMRRDLVFIRVCVANIWKCWGHLSNCTTWDKIITPRAGWLFISKTSILGPGCDKWRASHQPNQTCD